MLLLAIFAAHDLTVNRGIVTAEAKSDVIDNAAFHAGQIVVKGSGGIRADAEGPRSVGLYNDTADGITVEAGNVLVNASGEGALGIKAKGKVAIDDKIGSFIAAGTRMAISGEVVNDVIGSGWNDAEGTGEKQSIAPSSEGQALSFKEIPHNMGGSLAGEFQPSAACKFLDLPPVSLRNLQATAD